MHKVIIYKVGKAGNQQRKQAWKKMPEVRVINIPSVKGLKYPD
ncbi:MAG TPA: hypothetical protein PLD84_05595 [Chitinophagales bacterium]|nr:hypothetical protein [Chitinophagales bacterium]